MKSLSRIRLLATPWTAAYQAPPSMGFSRQESWSGLPLPSPKVPLHATIWVNLDYIMLSERSQAKGHDCMISCKWYMKKSQIYGHSIFVCHVSVKHRLVFVIQSGMRLLLNRNRVSFHGNESIGTYKILLR